MTIDPFGESHVNNELEERTMTTITKEMTIKEVLDMGYPSSKI